MGGALLEGWIRTGRPAGHLHVIEPRPSAAIRASGVTCHAGPDALPPEARFGAIVFAVKPDALARVLPDYAVLAGRTGTLCLSIAAGKTLDFLTRHLGADASVIRAMPNTPAAIGRGITALVAAPGVTAAQKSLAEDLLRPAGRCLWLEDEGQMDAVTAISGSGPAYVFLLTECLAEAGIAEGLPAEIAQSLARETVTGAAALLAETDAAPAVLRRNVTSPGGTTEAALGVLAASDGLGPLLARAVAAAAGRSRDLAD